MHESQEDGKDLSAENFRNIDNCIVDIFSAAFKISSDCQKQKKKPFGQKKEYQYTRDFKFHHDEFSKSDTRL